jgi:hypothetical protein
LRADPLHRPGEGGLLLFLNSLIIWISLGNNWDSSRYDTPYRWGLDWTPANTSIFGFRGLIKAYSWQGESGLQSLDAFDVSDIHWFRIKEIYML